MTRVFGQLFSDGRDGILAIKPSKPFFGCEQDEQHFDVIDGAFDCELRPTPTGISYLIGFKGLGDTRRTQFTDCLQVPYTEEIEIEPQNGVIVVTASSQASNPTEKKKDNFKHLRVQLKSMAERQEKLIEQIDELHSLNEALQSRIEKLIQERKELVRSQEASEDPRLTTKAVSSSNSKPVVLPVQQPSPEAAFLINRINSLEVKLADLSSEKEVYYAAYVELNRLKLKEASKASSTAFDTPDTKASLPHDPRRRLLDKLQSK